jgi:hypothetical protein
MLFDGREWKRNSVIDDHGQLWIDLMPSRDGVEAIKRGEKAPIFVTGRRARH